MSGGSTGDFWDALGGDGVGVRTACIPTHLQFQASYRKSLRAKTWSQVLESRDVLAHDLLHAQIPLVHSVLLEGPYKFRKHQLDPEFSQKAITGDVFGEGPWNALQEAESGECKISDLNNPRKMKTIYKNILKPMI